MKLRVKNLGPIKQGEIDLSKRFFVFVGYNNTGKTYMAQVLWSVLDFSSDNYIFTRTLNLDYGFPKDLEIGDEWVTDLKPLLSLYEKELNQKIIEDLNNDSLKNFELDLSDSFKSFTENTFSYGIRGVEKFYSCFKDKDTTKIKVKRISEDEYKELRNKNDRSFHASPFKEMTDYFYDFIVKALNPFKAYHNSTFLPANRAFYPTFYRYIYQVAKERNELINKAVKAGKDINEIRRLAKTDYSKAMDSLTSLVNGLNTNEIVNTNYQTFIDDLQKIIGGDIDIQRVEGFSPIEFKFKLNETVLDMHAASSSVNQLTVLNTYFKYWASEKNNFLIMDEPEENLHPKNQIALLNLLMKFANQNNNKVLITTHSPLITDAVNNHLHLGYLKSLGENIDALIEENHLNIDKEAAMSHEDIGVYFFDGQSIRPYEINSYGVFFKDFRKYEKEVEDTSNLLTNRIYDILEKRRDDA